MIELRNATSATQMEQVRHLLRAFVDWHRRCHAEDRRLIDGYFEDKAFEEEPAALRAIDRHARELKRMFVYPEFHGKRTGRALAERLIRGARVINPCC